MKTVRDLRPVYVAGIGLHPYQYVSETPYVSLGLEAVREALDDAGIAWPDVDSAFVGTARLGMAAGVPMLRYLGATGLPVTHVENASATGCSTFRQAVIEVGSGFSDVSLAVGVDKPIGALAAPSTGIPSMTAGLVAPFSHFALITERYMRATGTPREQIGLVAVKNHRNGAANPYAQRRKIRTLDEVLAPPFIAGSLNSLQCTPVGEGAAAVIVVSEDAIAHFGLEAGRCVKVVASAISSERPAAGQGNPDVDLTRATTLAAYEQWSGEPNDLDVIEVHDAFAIEELLYIEAMGLCPEGEVGEGLERGHFDIGGRHAVSPSGGLLAMGHPIGPTGLGQIAEVTRQLRGEAGSRQHPGASVGLTHMVGIGPVCVVHILQR
jgi:acetyl-CoA acetyltransferase